MFCVIVGDIINSRGMKGETFINKPSSMDDIFQRINDKYSKYIMSDFGTVRGDAFEGITYSQAESVCIIEDLIRLFYEQADAKIRISCVSGELENNSLDHNKSDGPAFYTAVEEINRMKEKTKKEKLQHWFQVKFVTNTIAQPLIDSILDLVAAITKRWTDQQRKIIWNMADSSFQQSIVSEKLSIAPSIISKQLKAANYQMYREAIDSLKTFLEAEEVENAKQQNASFTILYSLGVRYNEQRKYNLSEKYITRALGKAKDEYGEYDIRLVPIYNGLVQSCVEQVSYGTISELDKKRLIENAAQAVDCSLSIQSRFPKDIKMYIQTITAKGNLLLEMGKYEEALCQFIRAKELVETFLGNDKTYIFGCNNNIALTYKELGKNREAYEWLMKNKKEVISRNNAITTADCLYNMGLVLINLKRYKKKKKCLNKAYEIFTKEYPLKHPLILDVKEALASIPRIEAQQGVE